MSRREGFGRRSYAVYADENNGLRDTDGNQLTKGVGYPDVETEACQWYPTKHEGIYGDLYKSSCGGGLIILPNGWVDHNETCFNCGKPFVVTTKPIPPATGTNEDGR